MSPACLPAFMALDAGTSGARCLIADGQGRVLATAARPWRYDSSADGAPYSREFSPPRFWEALGQAAREALARSGLAGSAIAAVSATGQRLGIVLLDGEGRELFASPNLDARALFQGLAFDDRHRERVYGACGRLPSFLLAPAKLRWLQEERPDLLAEAACLLTVPDWVLFRLTGRAVAERAAATEAGLVEVASGEWAGELLGLWGFPRRLLPPLVDAGGPVGAVTAAAAAATGLPPGTPVYAGGPDTQCGLLGLGLLGEGDTGLILGWSGALQMVTTAPRWDREARTWTGRHVAPGAFVVEANLQEAGNALHWLADLLFGGDLEEAHRRAAEGPLGAGGALACLGPAPPRPGPPGLRLGGLFFPVPLAAGPPDAPRLFRAALENLAFAVRAHLALLEEVAGRKAQRIALGGGVARSDAIASILADVLERPIEAASPEVNPTKSPISRGPQEVSALGAALCAAVGHGLCSWEELPRRAAPQRELLPRAAEAAAYQEIYRSWLELGQAVERAGAELGKGRRPGRVG